jgi:hypothetical protein
MKPISGYVGPVAWRALVETSNLEPAADERDVKWRYPWYSLSK